ncbi:group 10 secretory phospholipase A2 [Dunckerocampus dactyliophorus]|uniref:group 10 secretory phospholipase A2 n=1 Tax=Dunckerocampus dactyliophorus TaxID=161453 RepID=UPI002406C15E|nr:group 10 secretory phospholipase A2 [Dunckerocampus dactyliophorus]
MTAFQRTLFLLAVVVATEAASSPQRTKRGILELAGIIKCTTGRSFFFYVFYGCYCGLGGHGKPKDETDRCCQKHDCCYADAEKEGCKPKRDNYEWTCEDNMASCDSLTDKCEKMLCECDRDAGKCLKGARYKWYYALWPNWACSSTTQSCDPL